MRRRLAIGLAAAVAVLAPVALAWAKNGPSRAQQIQAAVSRAEGTSSTWATVNICHPNTIGIRAQMASLGNFDARMSMSFDVEYYSPKTHVYRMIPGTGMSVSLGNSRLGLRQSGVTVPLTAHSGLLRGVTTMTWSINGQVVGSTTRVTSSGHPDADFGQPAHHSSAICALY